MLLVGIGALWLPSLVEANTSQVIITLLFTILAAGIIMFVFHRVGITRDSDSLPGLLYMLAISVFPSLHVQWQSQLVVCVVMIVVNVMFAGFRDKDTAEDSFLATLLLLFSSFLVPDVLFLVPMVWVGYILMAAFNLRTLLASFLALGVFVIYLCIGVYMHWLTEPFAHLTNRTFIFFHMDLEEWIMTIAILCMGIYFFIFTLLRLDRDSLRQQTLLTLLSLFFLPQLGIAIFPAIPITSQPISLALLTGLATLFFRQCQNVHRGIVLVVYVLMLIAGRFVPNMVF